MKCKYQLLAVVPCPFLFRGHLNPTLIALSLGYAINVNSFWI